MRLILAYETVVSLNSVAKRKAPCLFGTLCLRIACSRCKRTFFLQDDIIGKMLFLIAILRPFFRSFLQGGICRLAQDAEIGFGDRPGFLRGNDSIFVKSANEGAAKTLGIIGSVLENCAVVNSSNGGRSMSPKYANSANDCDMRGGLSI